jgi:hypothetical protein
VCSAQLGSCCAEKISQQILEKHLYTAITCVSAFSEKRQLKENERKVGRITRVITCVCLLLVKLQLKENERKFKKITIATGWCEN